MKKGTEKFIKTTSVIVELGIDFQANDLETENCVMKTVKKEVLEKIVRTNFNSINCPRISWFGWYDKETQTCRITVEEDLFI